MTGQIRLWLKMSVNKEATGQRGASELVIRDNRGAMQEKRILSIQRNRLINFFRVIAYSLVLLHSFAPSTLAALDLGTFSSCRE